MKKNVYPMHMAAVGTTRSGGTSVESRKIEDLRTFRICKLSKFRKTRRNLCVLNESMSAKMAPRVCYLVYYYCR